MLAADTDLVCPSCSGVLAAMHDRVVCRRCRISYATVESVPMLLPGLTVVAGNDPDPGFVEDISALAAAHQVDLASSAMRNLFSKTFNFPDSRLGAEGHRFLHRMRSSGYAIREPYKQPPPQTRTVPPQTRGPVKLTLLTAPTAVRAGQDFWVQVRIANEGRTALHATGPGALTLSYGIEGPFRWAKLRRDRTRSDVVSRLLIDLAPGQALTQPVRMTAPDRIGPVRYRVTPVRAEDDWLDDLSLRVTITNVEPSAPDPFEVDWPYSPATREYGEDHNHAVSLVKEWLGARFGNLQALRVLELGGNAWPIVLTPGFGLAGARCYNLDIDPFGLVFGAVQRRLCGGRFIQDLVADGMRVPFANGSLDVIVMFATLHHFPDPVGLLRHLATKLAPGGLIVACCEPVGHVSHETVSAGFREELLGGICEQAFEPWEWRSLFDRAGLRIAEVQHDRGSLKVALEPAGSLR